VNLRFSEIGWNHWW